ITSKSGLGGSMKAEELAKQLELYSNAIVAFVVVQGLTFCYDFAKEGRFNELVKTKHALSAGLCAMFAMTLIAATYANQYLGRQLASMDSAHHAIIRTVYGGKTVVIVCFGLLPLLVTLAFGLR